MPFGGGARRCLGAALALETLAVLTRVVLETRDLCSAGRPVEGARLSGTTLAPARGGRVVLERRPSGPEVRPRTV
jgi:cytochrome P450